MSLTAFDLWDRRSLAMTLTAIDESNGALQLEIKRLEALIDARAKDPALEAEKNKLELSQKDKLTLRRFLDQEVPGNADGFSAYLADLARFHVRGLRLTDIRCVGG
jgi:hypothetical protein